MYDLAANNLEVDALFVYTKTGHMASLLSRCRPDCPIFAFTSTTSVRRRLNLQWGLIPFRLSFSDDMESNLNKTFALLKARNLIKSGDLVIAVSDILQSIQVMNVPWERASHQNCRHPKSIGFNCFWWLVERDWRRNQCKLSTLLSSSTHPGIPASIIWVRLN